MVAFIFTVFNSWFKPTSFGNRDDRFCGLLCYCDGGFWDLSQQVHQVTDAIVDNAPVSRKAPDTQSKEYILHYQDAKFFSASTTIKDNVKASLTTPSSVDWPVVCLHEVLDCNLFAGLKFEQFEQILGEALHLSPMGQGQQTLGTHAQDL